LLICACALPDEAWYRRSDGRNYNMVDVAIVVDYLTLAATELGLGTCWVAAFDPVAAREILHLPDDVEPVAFTPLGYPADQPQAKSRRPLSELVRYEQW
jgi:nitroreductase